MSETGRPPAESATAGPGQPLKQSAAIQQMLETIRSLRSAVASRDQIIAEYQKRLAELQHQAEGLQQQLRTAQTEAETIGRQSQHVQQLTEARLAELARLLEAQHVVQGRLVEACLKSYELQLAHCSRDDDQQVRQAIDRWARTRQQELLRQVQHDRQWAAEASDLLALVFLLDVRRYGYHLERLQEAVDQSASSDQPERLADLRRQVHDLEAGVMDRLRQAGESLDDLRARWERFAQDVLAERDLRQAVDQAGRDLAAVLEAVRQAEPDSADRLSERLRTRRETWTEWRAQAVTESGPRRERMRAFWNSHGLFLAWYRHHRQERFDLQVAAEPDTFIEILLPRGPVRSVWSGRTGQVLVTGLAREGTYRLRTCRPDSSLVERTVTAPEPSDRERLVDLAWSVLADDGPAVGSILDDLLAALEPAEQWLGCLPAATREYQRRRQAAEMERRVADLARRAATRTAGQLDDLCRQTQELRAAIEAGAEAVRAAGEADRQVLLAFAEAWPSFRPGLLTEAFVAELRAVSGLRLADHLQRDSLWLRELSEGLTVDRIAGGLEELLERTQRLTQAAHAMARAYRQWPELDERLVREGLRCPSCAEKWSAEVIPSPRFGAGVHCPHCGVATVLVWQVSRLIGRGRQLREQMSQWLQEANRLDEERGRFQQTHAPALRRLVAGRPDYRSPIYTDALAAQAAEPDPAAADRLAAGRRQMTDQMAAVDTVVELLGALAGFVQYRDRLVDLAVRARRRLEHSRQLDWSSLDAAYVFLGSRRYGPLIQEKVYKLGGLQFALRLDEEGRQVVLMDSSGLPLAEPFETDKEVTLRTFPRRGPTTVRVSVGARLLQERTDLMAVRDEVAQALRHLMDGGPRLALSRAQIDSTVGQESNPFFSEGLQKLLHSLAEDGASAVIKPRLGKLLAELGAALEAEQTALERVAFFQMLQSCRYRMLQITDGCHACAREMLQWAGQLRSLTGRLDEILGRKQPEELPPERAAAYRAVVADLDAHNRRWEALLAQAREFIRTGDRVFERLRGDDTQRLYDELTRWLEADAAARQRLLGNRPGGLKRLSPAVTVRQLKARLDEFETAIKLMESAAAKRRISPEACLALQDFQDKSKDAWVS